MQILSVQVGQPRLVMRHGEPISTAIYKEPVTGRVKVNFLNLAGDRQADLQVHGGPAKAIYLYPSEHYEFWRLELPASDLPYGVFGENLTTAGLSESQTYIGDKFRIGSAIVRVTEPRMPCYKLALRLGRSDIIKRFLLSERTGFYLAVEQEGELETGDEIELVERPSHDVRVSDITRLYARDKGNQKLLKRVIGSAALSEGWRDYFQRQLKD